MGRFLFNNMVRATISPTCVDINYLRKFELLKVIDVANVFKNMSDVMALVKVLPKNT